MLATNCGNHRETFHVVQPEPSGIKIDLIVNLSENGKNYSVAIVYVLCIKGIKQLKRPVGKMVWAWWLRICSLLDPTSGPSSLLVVPDSFTQIITFYKEQGFRKYREIKL